MVWDKRMDVLLNYPEMSLKLLGGALVAFPLLGDSLSAGIQCHTIIKPVESNMDTIKDIINGASQIGHLLGNASTEQAANASDRVGAVQSTNATLLSQATTKTKFGFFPSTDAKDNFLSQAVKKGMSESNKMKIIELASADWREADVEGHVLMSVKLPEIFYDTPVKPAHGPTRPFGAIRTNFSFEVQANAVTGASGSLGIYYLPPGVDSTKRNLRTWRLLPSDELNIGVNTSAKLYVPYTHYQNYVTTDSQDLGEIVVFCWSRLVVPPNTTNVGLTIFGAMDQTDLQMPRPQGPINARIREGPGVMNVANCKQTRLAESLALAGETVAVDPHTSGSSRAVRNLADLTKVFAVNHNTQTKTNFTTAWETSSGRGTVLYQTNVQMTDFNGIVNMFANAFRFWRGSVVFRVSVFNSTLHKGRLRLAFYPSTTDFTAENAQNSFFTILDIGLNPCAELVIPFMSLSWLRDTGEDFGRFKVFVSSPLSASSNCAPRVRFVVETRMGDDAEFCVPFDRGLVFQNNDDDEDYTDWGNSAGDVQVTDSLVDAGTAAAASSSGLSAPSQEVEKPGVGETPKQAVALAAIVKKVKVVKANHMLASVLFGRATYLGEIIVSVATVQALPVIEPTGGLASLLKLFAYFNADMVLHVRNDSAGDLFIAHSYVNELRANAANMSTLGLVAVPPGAFMSVTVPFYNVTPARSLSGEHPFGYLYYETTAPAKISVWMSFKTISLFQPIMVPLWATVRSYITDNRDTQWRHPHQDAINELAFLRLWDRYLSNLDRIVPQQMLGPGPNAMHYNEMMGDPDEDDEDQYAGWQRDLTQDGDVESNPGPLCSLVYLPRGLYKHYGVRYKDKVFNMGSENVLAAAVSGKVHIALDPWHPGWVEEKSVDITTLRLKGIEQSVGTHSYFSASSNCETYAREALGIESIGQARALAVFGLILLGATAICVAPQGETDESNVFTGFTARVRAAGQTCLSKVQGFFSEVLFDAVKCDLAKTIFKLLLRVVCYGILFCSSPGLLTAAAVAGLIAMDMASIDGLSSTVKDLCAALLDGDLCKCVEAMTNIVHQNSDDRQDMIRDCMAELRASIPELAKVKPKPATASPIYADGNEDPFRLFNSSTTAAKNIGWWMDILARLLTWLKSFFCEDNVSKCIDWMKKNKDHIMQIMVDADSLVLESRDATNLRRKDFQADVTETTKRLTHLKFIALNAHAIDVTSQCGMLLSKLHRIPKPVASDQGIFRMEPIGVWVSGDPGCGKSSFTYELLSQLRLWLKDREVKVPDSGVYTTPSGSQHMDGYNGQWLHVIDDMAQNKEEEDVKFLCQMISSVPWTTPQAEIESKGTQYCSQIVVATTNRNNFESCVLYDSKALQRRFPFTFTLKPSANYRTDDGRLDVTKAAEAKTLANASCWDIAKGVPGTDFRIGNMKQIVHSIGCAYLEKLKLTTLLCSKYEPLKGTTALRQPGMNWQDFLGDLKKPVMKTDGVMDDLPTLTKESAADFEKWVSETDVQAKVEECLAGGAISEEMIHRLKQSMCYISSTAFDTPFESCIEMPRKKIGRVDERIKTWFKSKMDGLCEWWTKWKPFFMAAGILGTVISTCTGIYMLYNYCKGTHPISGAPVPEMTAPVLSAELERPYQGMVRQKPKIDKTQKVKIHPDGPNPAEYSHLFKAAATLQVGGKTVYGIVVRPHTVMTYKHYWERCGGGVESLTWNGLKHIPEPCSVQTTAVELESDCGEPVKSDYIFLTFLKCPFQMKTVEKMIAPPDIGSNGVALMAHPAGNYAQNVNNVQLSGAYVVGFADGDEVCSDSVCYETKSFAGMCGAMICQKIGGAWKVIAMHHAGNRHTFGFGCRIRVPELPDGVVTKKEKAPKPHYTPTKTKIEKSPLHGVVPVEMGPAPLHARDPRVEADIPSGNLVKEAAGKYRVDVYEPDPVLMNQVVMYTAQQLFAATGRCGEWTLEEALSGGDGNQIDMNTSPGVKYTSQNLRKKDLFKKNPDGTWWVWPDFRDDVDEQIRAAHDGKATTVFAATLKDELRPLEKIALGKTRCIEACNVDYTVAHRMIFGPLYEKIYEATPLQTGIAVGCNPFTDFHNMHDNMKRNWFTIDYSRFDGSLSHGLMTQAAQILAACTNEPTLAANMLKPVIDSVHLVADEVWDVRGGMPSGSPCTSVLNSVCNLLVVRYALLESGFGLNEVVLSTYGDDVIGSAHDKIPSFDVIETIKKVFGMEATSADKKSGFLSVLPSEATFLKRKFVPFPGTRFVTGQLDLNSMLQKIQWCHGIDEFKQQLTSFTQELVLHGEEVYTSVAAKCQPVLDKYKILIPTYKQRYVEVYDIIFG